MSTEQPKTPPPKQDMEGIVKCLNELLEKRPEMERMGYATIISPSVHRVVAFLTAQEKESIDVTPSAPTA